jgi:hypothetical protein
LEGEIDECADTGNGEGKVSFMDAEAFSNLLEWVARIWRIRMF